MKKSGKMPPKIRKRVEYSWQLGVILHPIFSILAFCGDLRDEAGQAATSNQEKAGILNRFFASNFTNEGTDDPPVMTMELVCQPVEDIAITPAYLAKKLSSLKPSSAPGPDAIRPRALRDSANALAIPLCTLFRKSLDSGMIPLDWRTGNVIPIHKKGDRQNPGNYRPVSLTSVPSKVLESMVRDQLILHMTEHGLFHPAQFGFLRKRSCTAQLTHC